ncbi:LysR substrate-binding domain-containing protein [Dasania marina]|uniref:LysR substrate-binding domain-containing protein n=1 Tax=Dasania marina TaxID=471499 RepID=UPI0003737242|nr:LysR substrate-binding domain-containing protein [Dasania marina]
MTLRNPKLDLLNTFARAAYHGNFTRAANELCITQAAVSRQIGILEEQLGIALFVRSNRGISLTEAAKPLYAILQQSLADIGQEVNRIHQMSNQETMRLSLAIDCAFADTWFKKRFAQFRQQHANMQIELQLITDSRPKPNVDVQIIYAIDDKPLQGPGFVSEGIYQPMDFVVCSPNIISKATPLQALSDLKQHSLLHEFTTELWPNWLQHMGVSDIETSQGAIVHDALLCLEMAANGEAVILSDDLVAADYLADGRLIKPLPHVRANEAKIYLVQNTQQAHNPAAFAFRQWLLAELAKHQQVFAELRQQAVYT